MSLQKGWDAEKAVREYLQSQGLIYKTSNYRTKMGEIDLIMQEGDYCVFIEVRARKTADFGNALETVTYAKQRKIMKTAAYYLQEHCLSDQVPCRFDVVAVQGQPPSIQWIQNAFGL